MFKHSIDKDSVRVPNDVEPYYINEPDLVDRYMWNYAYDFGVENPEEEPDNIRVYIPMDLNKKAILRRLDEIIMLYGGASEKNELNYKLEVDMLLAQMEIYDQILCSRHKPLGGNHSKEGIDLVKEIIVRLEDIPDECAECFPFETIDELREEYLGDF